METLRNLVTEGAATGHFYRDKVQRVMQGSYSHHYRRIVPALLDVLAFTQQRLSINPPFRPWTCCAVCQQ